ncbi:collagen alpha-1(III) chain-like [Aquila chrysaetos chrysaetos]|uniref:collagen alpha-1(III) chain-like n=1 Tax=Aquila chrysaetos chrysaetos TaxID=223781 RepID=UPI00117668C2|nr:collagen alpha-1(III) chain-like [Aquila chrysaetos chrysaetos]
MHRGGRKPWRHNPKGPEVFGDSRRFGDEDSSGTGTPRGQGPLRAGWLGWHRRGDVGAQDPHPPPRCRCPAGEPGPGRSAGAGGCRGGPGVPGADGRALGPAPARVGEGRGARGAVRRPPAPRRRRPPRPLHPPVPPGLATPPVPPSASAGRRRTTPGDISAGSPSRSPAMTRPPATAPCSASARRLTEDIRRVSASLPSPPSRRPRARVPAVPRRWPQLDVLAGLASGLAGALGGTALLVGLALLGRRCWRRNSDTVIYLNVLPPSARAPKKLPQPPTVMENSMYQGGLQRLRGPPMAPQP